MIRAARQQGLPITCDVSANHIHLSEMDIGFFNSNCHLIPPLRALGARILGVEAGCLSPGATADLCIFDPEQYWKVEAAALKSQGKNTPFLGMELPGRVKYTLINGNIVHEG